MALTASEQEELKRLEDEIAREEERERGEQALARIREEERVKNEPRPFSIYRASVGALRDAAQGVSDTIVDIGDFLENNVAGLGGFKLGDAASNGWIEYESASARRKRLAGDAEARESQLLNLPTLKGEENAGTAERIVRGIGSFAVPFVGISKVVRGIGLIRGSGFLGSAARGTIAGSAATFTNVDPVSSNMANFVQDTFGIDNPTLDALAAEEDDSRLLQRFKAAIADIPVGIASDALMEAGFRSVRAYREWRGTRVEAEETINAIKADIKIDRTATPDPTIAAFSRTADDAGAEAAGTTTGRAYNPETDIPRGTAEAPEDFEDIIDFLKKKADGDTDPDALRNIAERALFSDPENGLLRMGIDPTKIDWTKFDDPQTLGKLLASLTDTFEGIAKGLGRTGIRVTEKATAEAARALATSADVLKDLYGSTHNLEAKLTAGRFFVNGHAHKLVSDADLALKELTSGVEDGPAWNEFLSSFHRHAYYLGAIRGAGSEVGRALRSLQILAQTGRKTASRNVDDALKAERAARPNATGEAASTYAERLVTPAQRIEALNRVINSSGNVEDLTRHVRQSNLTIIGRTSAILKETVGNLFSVATATYNALSGGVMLGGNALARSLSFVARGSMAPFSKTQADAARVALLDTWAYTEGILGGFREAYNATMQVLAKEGFAESQLILDSIGLRGLATKSAQASGKAERTLAEGFERTDVKNARQFSVSPARQKALEDAIGNLNGPQFVQTAMLSMTRLIAGAMNTAGSLSRTGTILFINLPDQFVGTLASRAGAYSTAVRLSAKEAGELGLEGSDLMEFIKARTVQLTSDLPEGGIADDGFEAGAREAMARHGHAEAKGVLFQDDLELGFNRAINRALDSVPFMHMVVPFIKTPLRILERTAIDYTPLGLFKDRIRDAIVAGGPARDEAIARMGLGMLAVTTAYQLAADRGVVGSDGAYGSSSRIARPMYSLRIGDDIYEFSRIDPLGTLLGIGADLATYERENDMDPEASQGAMEMFEALLWGTSANILSKTWLTSLKSLTDLAGATSDEMFSTRLRSFVTGMATRFVPASGVQRQINAAADGQLREAFTFSDSVLRASIGDNTLPVRRDRYLGRPVQIEGFGRTIGARAAPGPNASEDLVATELEELSFDVGSARKTIEGVKLTGSQFSRWLELRGQVQRHPNTGLTLEETLDALFRLPEYRELPRASKVEAIRAEMKGFGREATAQLIREDDDFAFRLLRKETYRDAELRGVGREEADAATAELAEQLGLRPKQ